MKDFIPEVLENLKSEIISKHGSIKAFSEKKGFDRFTLCRVFMGRQNISLGQYLDLCVSLGVLPPESNILPRSSSITLKDYLSLLDISQSAVITSILKLTLG